MGQQTPHHREQRDPKDAGIHVAVTTPSSCGGSSGKSANSAHL